MAAIVGFVISLLSILIVATSFFLFIDIPLVPGLIFSIALAASGVVFSQIGLKRADRMDGVGRGLAIIGRNCSIAAFCLLVAFAALIAWIIYAAGPSQRDDVRKHDLGLISAAVEDYIESQATPPRTWSDIADLVDGDLKHYVDGTNSINPANASGEVGNLAGVFPQAPVDPTEGDSDLIDHDVIVIWVMAECWWDLGKAQVVAAGPGEFAILHRLETHHYVTCLDYQADLPDPGNSLENEPDQPEV